MLTGSKTPPAQRRRFFSPKSRETRYIELNHTTWYTCHICCLLWLYMYQIYCATKFSYVRRMKQVIILCSKYASDKITSDLLLKYISKKIDEKIWSVSKSKLNIICHVYHVERLSLIKSNFRVFSCFWWTPLSRQRLWADKHWGVLSAFRKWSSTITTFHIMSSTSHLQLTMVIYHHTVQDSQIPNWKTRSKSKQICS